MTQVTHELHQKEVTPPSETKQMKVANTERNKAIILSELVDQKQIEFVQEDDHILLHVKDTTTYSKLKPLLELKSKKMTEIELDILHSA